MLVRLAWVAAVLTLAAGCHQPAAPARPAPTGNPAPATLALAVDALFVAASLHFVAELEVTDFADEDGDSTSRAWDLDCVQAPLPSPPGRRVAKLTCHSRERDVEGESPFPMLLDGYWVATADAVWHVADLDEPLVAVARLMSLPPAPRRDEVPDPEPAEGGQEARTIYETSLDDSGAWCHQRSDDMGGLPDPSTWTVCFDGRGLVSGSTSSDAHAVVSEARFTRR